MQTVVVTAPAALSVTNATIAPAITRSALAAAGVPVTVTVPAGAEVLRVRVLTTARSGAGARRVRVLYRAFRPVKAGRAAQRLRFRVRSRALSARVRPGRRYMLDLTPGVGTKKLGTPARIAFRVR